MKTPTNTFSHKYHAPRHISVAASNLDLTGLVPKLVRLFHLSILYTSNIYCLRKSVTP